MKTASLLLCALILAGCATGPSPQAVAFKSYIDQNRPLAEAGTIKWSQYYTGWYPLAHSAGVPPFVLTRGNDLIKYAHEYEAGSITKEQFDYHRRAANAANMADAQAAQERDQDRRIAAAAAFTASAPPPQPIYQIVTPRVVAAPAPAYAPVAPFQPATATAYFTGRQTQVQTVTYQMAWKCEYSYAGNTFTRLFQTSCPSSVPVQ